MFFLPTKAGIDSMVVNISDVYFSGVISDFIDVHHWLFPELGCVQRLFDLSIK